MTASESIKSLDAERIIEQKYNVSGVVANCIWSDRTSSIWDICNWKQFKSFDIPLYVRINRPYVTRWEPELIEV